MAVDLRVVADAMQVDAESDEESEVWGAEQLRALIDGMDRTVDDGEEAATSRCAKRMCIALCVRNCKFLPC